MWRPILNPSLSPLEQENSVKREIVFSIITVFSDLMECLVLRKYLVDSKEERRKNERGKEEMKEENMKILIIGIYKLILINNNISTI